MRPAKYIRKESEKRLMAKAATTITMDELLALEDANVKQLVQGEVISGTVLSVRKHEVLIDLGAQGVGLATTYSVVSSSILILFSNYIITSLFFKL